MPVERALGAAPVLDRGLALPEVGRRALPAADQAEVFQDVLEHLPQGVSIVDGDLDLWAFNRAFVTLLDLPPDLVRIGVPLATLLRYRAGRGDFGPGDPAQEVQERLARSREPGPRCSEETRAGGRVLEVVATPMARGWVVTTYTDVTEWRGREEALRQGERHLRQAQKMDAVGRLAGGVAHDFNNLLTVIGGRAELLLGALPAGDAKRRHVDVIQQTTDRAADLTRQLLAFSRKQLREPRVLDLNAVIDKMVTMLRRLIGEHITLVSVAAPRLGRVRADLGQLEQVIVDLAVNARDAMPQGGTLTVETANVDLDETWVRAHAGSRPGSYVCLAVSDTGMGMDEETRLHVFEPFFSTKGPGRGTGLGLATVYGIVKQSDGYVRVDSAPGQGARFEIYLPQVDAPPEEPPALRAVGLPSGCETVLLVEDQAEVRELAHELLQMLGYSVLSARHGREALRVAESHQAPLHLLLTDVVMPHMGGRELADRLAPLRPDMRVLFMSGHTDDTVVEQGVLAPGTVLLSKPFTAEVLASRVREILDGAPSAARAG